MKGISNATKGTNNASSSCSNQPVIAINDTYDAHMKGLSKNSNYSTKVPNNSFGAGQDAIKE
jgi:hypothetical protein